MECIQYSQSVLTGRLRDPNPSPTSDILLAYLIPFQAINYHRIKWCDIVGLSRKFSVDYGNEEVFKINNSTNKETLNWLRVVLCSSSPRGSVVVVVNFHFNFVIITNEP